MKAHGRPDFGPWNDCQCVVFDGDLNALHPKPKHRQNKNRIDREGEERGSDKDRVKESAADQRRHRRRWSHDKQNKRSAGTVEEGPAVDKGMGVHGTRQNLSPPTLTNFKPLRSSLFKLTHKQSPFTLTEGCLAYQESSQPLERSLFA